ncbi:39S ribosomal protein L47, mitochondrial [Quillaja saponaria]|uniref:Large ribosomal subunit protein uL29m n=1 Tax=Quillaja saponaria TaxID=32244 RepID=A0AAD7KU67_QUISA|nr:39S ribosomal protein L47, mitochondrial [Quillaja saponaria]KAJ7945905.1 39S ribosomal protein L47, mitochondrial [Quillaja saponaria]
MVRIFETIRFKTNRRVLVFFLSPIKQGGSHFSRTGDQAIPAASTSPTMMSLSRVFGRALFGSAKSESHAAYATAASSGHNPLEAFFEADRSVDDDKPVVYGRSWKASELRLKSWDNLHKLWYVLLKEKNMLMTQRQMLHAQNLRFSNPERIPKVRKSMCRIKQVLTERAIEDPDPRRSAEMKRMINAL